MPEKVADGMLFCRGYGTIVKSFHTGEGCQNKDTDADVLCQQSFNDGRSYQEVHVVKNTVMHDTFAVKKYCIHDTFALKKILYT